MQCSKFVPYHIVRRCARSAMSRILSDFGKGCRNRLKRKACSRNSNRPNAAPPASGTAEHDGMK